MNNYDYLDKPKVKLFFDIETLPADNKIKKTVVDLLYQRELSKNLKFKKNERNLDYIYRQTAISGDFGQIFCIGYAIGDEEIDVIKGTEQEILKSWWQLTEKADLFIGHNIMDFDLRFIYKRSIVNNIKPSAKHLNMSFARYRNFPIFDTMREWEKWNTTSFIKLDTLAKALGLQSSKDGGIDGSKVYDYYLDNKFEEIYDYCARDVKLTREVYKKMTFEH